MTANYGSEGIMEVFSGLAVNTMISNQQLTQAEEALTDWLRQHGIDDDDYRYTGAFGPNGDELNALLGGASRWDHWQLEILDHRLRQALIAGVLDHREHR